MTQTIEKQLHRALGAVPPPGAPYPARSASAQPQPSPVRPAVQPQPFAGASSFCQGVAFGRVNCCCLLIAFLNGAFPLVVGLAKKARRRLPGLALSGRTAVNSGDIEPLGKPSCPACFVHVRQRSKRERMV